MSYATPPSDALPSQRESPLHSPAKWQRVFFTVVCVLLYGVSRVVVSGIVVFQVFTLLITGEPNHKLFTFGQALARYTYQLVRYLTFVTEHRPFPFDLNWPREKDSQAE